MSTSTARGSRTWSESRASGPNRPTPSRAGTPTGGSTANGGALPPPAEVGETPRLHARLVTLSSPRLGLIAKLDLIESDGGRVVPVDCKRGKHPHVGTDAHDPERV